MRCQRVFARLLLAIATVVEAVDTQAYDKLIRENPRDYMAYYKRATAYLMAHKDAQALSDLRAALAIEPSFEPALYYSARTNLRLGYAERALQDAVKCKGERCREVEQDAHEFSEHAANAATEQKGGDLEECVAEASRGLRLASESLNLRRIRFECYMAQGNTNAAMADLTRVVALDKSDTRAVAMLAKIEFLVNNEQDKALQVLRRCVTFDPDAKDCVQTSKHLRKLAKELARSPLEIDYQKIAAMVQGETANMGLPEEDSQNSALLDKLRHDRCEALAGKRAWKKAAKVCAEVRDSDPDFIPAVIVQARLELSSGNLAAANQLISPLIHHGVQDQAVHELYREIREKQNEEFIRQQQQQQQMRSGIPQDKDLYKVLGVEKDADGRTIKKAYRALSKQYHPDKYRGGKLSEDEVMAKMQEINEAYEILSDQDKRQEYDLGASGGGSGPRMRQGGQHGGQYGGAQFDDDMIQQIMRQFQGGGGGGGGQHFQFAF